MTPLLDDILSLLALALFNVAVGFLLYGFAPTIAVWAAR
jgi:hypothetical protein